MYLLRVYIMWLFVSFFNFCQIQVMILRYVEVNLVMNPNFFSTETPKYSKIHGVGVKIPSSVL